MRQLSIPIMTVAMELFLRLGEIQVQLAINTSRVMLEYKTILLPAYRLKTIASETVVYQHKL